MCCGPQSKPVSLPPTPRDALCAACTDQAWTAAMSTDGAGTCGGDVFFAACAPIFESHLSVPESPPAPPLRRGDSAWMTLAPINQGGSAAGAAGLSLTDNHGFLCERDQSRKTPSGRRGATARGHNDTNTKHISRNLDSAGGCMRCPALIETTRTVRPPGTPSGRMPAQRCHVPGG